jgi:Arf-GAP with SH3 domain, ANK repeat and PH domain-containing protein
MLRDNDQGNCWCADCGSGAKVEWVSINLAIILCIECSGIHRSLGTHISKVRSLTLDITSFTTDIIELLLLVGNRVANMVWEAKLDPATKLAPTTNREQRLRFITAKYVDRAYVEPISATLSSYSTADETLLASVKKNDIQQVIYALALKANPNATDLSRGTHVVFLALAAADPASPSPTPSPVHTPRPGTSGAGAGPAGPKAKQVPFPVAELLLQNGAQIPATLPAFPLSRSAQHYVEAKRGRVSGPNVLDSSSGNSTSGSGAVAGAHPSSTPSSSGMGTMERLAREKEARLQKRVSAGGRLAKSPIPER